MPRTLIHKIVAEHQYPLLTEENYAQSVSQEAVSMVVFAGDPKRYPEALDVIVVVPELEKAFPDAFKVSVVAEEAERALAQQYAITAWPALVFLKQGQYVDKIARIQDWQVYLEEIPKILTKAPTRNPSIGIGIEVK